MNQYAAQTSVPTGRSRDELEELLRRMGAEEIGSAQRPEAICVYFKFKGPTFRFTMPTPTPESREVKFFPSGKMRPQSAREEMLRQCLRSRWRALVLTIKAMLVGVEAGIFNFAEVFSPYMVWGDGRTTWETLLPLAEESASRNLPLPHLGATVRPLLEAQKL